MRAHPVGASSLRGRWTYVFHSRFVYSPKTAVEKRLSSETTELKCDITNMNKKLHYLETTHKNSREHIDQIFRSGGRA